MDPYNNTPNNTFVSMRPRRNEAMLLIDLTVYASSEKKLNERNVTL